MRKFPRLEQLRAERFRREAEITEPHQAELRVAAAQISRLRASVRAMERFLGEKIAGYVIEGVAHRVTGELMRLISAAVAKQQKREPVKVTLPPDVFYFMNPRSIESYVVERYAQQALPKLYARIEVNPADCVTVVDIRVPELGCRQAVTL